MLENGASLHAPPIGGINQLLASSFWLNDWEQKINYLLHHGASLRKLPNGPEEIFNNIQEDPPWPRLSFLLENGAPPRYCSYNLGRILQRVYADNGLHSADVDHLLRYIPQGIDVLLRESFFLYGVGPEIEELLQLGADWKEIPYDSMQGSPLGRAVQRGDIERIQYLLGKVDIDGSIDIYGDTPLHAAAESGHLQVAQMLLDHGAKCNPRSRINGSVPLALACTKPSNVEHIEYLIKKGANICAVDLDGRSPLLIAAHLGHTDAVSCLLDWGADMHVVDRWEMTALDHAAERGDDKMVHELLKRSARIGPKACKPVVLFCAARAGFCNAAESLLSQGVHVDSETTVGVFECGYPLEVATEYGNLSMVRLLLRHGASVNFGLPLYLAVTRGDLEIAKLLLDSGADPNLGPLPKDTALHAECANTPLHTACTFRSVELIEALLQAGAQPSILNSEGQSSLQIAIMQCHPKAVKSLLKGGSNPNGDAEEYISPLNLAIQTSQPHIAEILIDSGADLNAANRKSQTPLHWAVYEKQCEAVAALIDAGAELNCVDRAGCTPLNAATEKGFVDIAKLLLDKGADRSLANAQGRTPL